MKIIFIVPCLCQKLSIKVSRKQHQHFIVSANKEKNKNSKNDKNFGVAIMDSLLTQPSERQDTEESESSVDTPKLLKRGRPRIDRSAETAGERRKEQIRLAQRAYRSRKELRIAVLDQTVAELERTIIAIRDLYLHMHNAILDSGVALSHPYLSQTLQRNFALLLSFTQSVSNTDDFDPKTCVDPEVGGQVDEVATLEIKPQPLTPSLFTRQAIPQSSLMDSSLSPFDSLIHGTATSPGDMPGYPSFGFHISNPHWILEDCFLQRPEMPINSR